MIVPLKEFILLPPDASILVNDANTLQVLLPLLGIRMLALVLAWDEVKRTIEPTRDAEQLNEAVMV